MKGVWRANVGLIAPVAGAIAALVGVNAVARVIVRLIEPDGEIEWWIGLWSLGAMVVVAAIAAFYWATRHLMQRLVADGLVLIVVTSLLVTLVGPFVSGNSPFSDSAFGEAFAAYLLQLIVCIGVLFVGVAIGVLLAMAFGLDPKSRAWKAQAARIRTSARQRQRGTARR